MANKVFIRGNYVVCQAVGDQTPQSIQDMGDKIASLLEELKTQRKPLLVLNNITQIGFVPPAARPVVVALAKSIPYERMAVLGEGGLLRLSTNLLIRASGRRRRLRYFSDQTPAMNWLLGR